MDAQSNQALRRKNYTSLSLLFVVYWFICLTPAMTYRVGGVMNFIFMALLLALVFIFDKRLIMKKVTLFILSFFVLDISYHLFGYSERIGNSLSHLSFFSCIIFYLFIRDNVRDKRQKQLFLILSVIVAANILDNIRLNTLYPMASILAVRYDTFAGLNIGTTAFNTMVLLFYCISLFLMLICDKSFFRLLSLLCAIMSVYYIVYCGMRGSVVLIMAIASVLFIMTKWVPQNSKYFLVVPVVSIMVLTLFELYQNEFYALLSSILPEGRLVDKLEDIQQTSEEGLDEHSLSGRYRLALVSLNSYLTNFITFLFGIGEHIESAKEMGYEHSGVGGHSEFFDVLARWGTIGAILISTIYYETYKIIHREFQKLNLTLYFKILFFTFILCTIFKKVFVTSIGIVVFIMFPLCLTVIKRNKSVKY